MRFEDQSYNFAVAKIVAILVVFVAHYFEGPLWVFGGSAMFVFAFSSGWFTARKYAHPVAAGAFYRAKISRLLVPLPPRHRPLPPGSSCRAARGF